MTAVARIESALEVALERGESGAAPPKLAAALRHAIFPGGARVRPQLTLAIARACGDDAPDLADAAAVAIEMLHCASLVHDDLPCFDDAATRRGRPSVHAVFGEPLAVLAGDALIIMALEGVARAGAPTPTRLAPLMLAITRGVGMPAGIIAGQAFESEPNPDVEAYHRAKTGALFVAAVTCGAIAAGADPLPWRALGDHLGSAYQVADDLLDAVTASGDCDKPTGQDSALGRPSLVAELGIAGAYARLETLVAQASAAVPDCDGADSLRGLVRAQAMRLAPRQLSRSAA
jgi:geranylgeranyl diphosphate synthase type II